MNLRPINNHVLVDPAKKEEKKTAAGIIIPDVNSKAARNRLERGTIVLAPNYRDPNAAHVKEGEVVYYKPGAGLEVMSGEKVYLVIPIAQLQLVLESADF